MADQVTADTASMSYLKSVRLTPEIFAATCQAIMEHPLDPMLGMCLLHMMRDLKTSSDLPREYVGDLYRPGWDSMQTLRCIFSPYYGKHISRSCVSPLIDFATPPPLLELPTVYLTTPGDLDEMGPAFVISVFAASGSLGRDMLITGRRVVLDILDRLMFTRMSTRAYLEHWLEKAKYKEQTVFTIPQSAIEGPGIFQIILSSTGVSTMALREEIVAYCHAAEAYLHAADVAQESSRSTAIAFVTALLTVDISAMSQEEKLGHCGFCWSDWDEASPPSVNHAIKKTPCGHLFGHHCLVECLKVDKLCPLCRQDMVALSKRPPST